MFLLNSEALHMLFFCLNRPWPFFSSLQVTSSRKSSLVYLTLGCKPFLWELDTEDLSRSQNLFCHVVIIS